MSSLQGPASTVAPTTPYVGLSHYGEDRANVFFGRDTERSLIIGNLRAARLTLLYAQSGVGKSSLLRAGVAARLRTLAQRSLAERRSAGYIPIVFSSWRDEPTEELERELREAVQPFATAPIDGEPGPRLDEAIQAAATAADATLLVILDQFEEYLLYSSREARSGRFADELAACINRGDLRANFLVAVREDAYAGLGDLFRGKLTNLYGNYLHLEYLDRQAAREAIVRPIEHFNAVHPEAQPVKIEPALVDAVLEQVQTGRVAFEHEGRGTIARGDGTDQDRQRIETPYLQLVMAALWDRERSAGSSLLRLSTLTGLGGAERIVHSHLDSAMSGLADAERETAIEVFNHLVTPSGTKIAHTISDLAGYSGHDPAQVQALVEKLTRGDQRILRPVPAAPGDEGRPRVEIFHDVLAPAILARRSAENSARLERRREAAEERAAGERRRARRFRALAGVSLALLGVAIVAAVVARVETVRAQRAQRAALRTLSVQRTALSLLLAADAVSDLQSGAIDQGALLSAEAYRYAPTDQAGISLVQALQATEAMVAYLGGHTAAVTSVAYAPGGRLIASAGADDTVVVQDLVSGRTVRVLRGASLQSSVAFSPNGKLLATGSASGKITLWNLATGRSLLTVRGSAGGVYGVAFSPDGTLLASAGADHSVGLWDVRTGRRLRVLRGHGAPVDSVAFSPDGGMLASASADHTVILWDVSTGRRLRTLIGSTAAVNSVVFAPDGSRLASGADDGTVALWSTDTGRRLMSLRGHAGSVNAVAYSPDGGLLASANAAHAVIVWDARTGRRLQTLRGHSAAVESVAFSPSGGTLASGGDDDHVIVWNTRPSLFARTLTTGVRVLSVAYSPRGRLLAAALADGTVAVWRTGSWQRVHLLAGHTGPVEDVAFSPDGSTLASAGADYEVILWNAATGTRERTLSGHRDFVYSLAFSPDGRTLASASADQTVILWSTSTGARERTLRGHTDFVYSVAFSPDSRMVAAAGADESVIIWDAASGRRLRTLTGHTAAVESLAFSPDGRTIAAGGDDRTVILWDARTGERVGDPLRGSNGSVLSVAFSPSGELLASAGTAQGAIVWDLKSRLGDVLYGHTGPIERLAFSPDGRTLATASLDQTVGLSAPLPSSVQPAAIDARLCGVVRRNLTRSEWTEFLPGKPYRRTCPASP